MACSVRNIFAAIVFTLSAAPALAQEGGPGDAPAGPPPWPPADRPWWVVGQLEYVSTYYYRGFFQEDEGCIVQPAMKLGYDVYRGDGAVNRVGPVVGFRASLHANETFATEEPAWVYELDLVGGLNFRLLDRLNVETLYVTIRSPNGAFGTIEEFNVNVQLDDMGLWGRDFAVKPFANFKIELDGSAVMGDEGAMVEVGVEPEFGLIKSPAFPLRISFPVTVGLSLSDYYALPAFGPFPGAEDETYGYTKAGVTLMLPLTFISPERGQWALTAGVDYIHLGDNLETFNRGKDHDIIGRFGFVMRY